MTDFLLELRSEEIPARMQEKAREDLARLFAAELDKAGLKAAEVVSYATPRRLALILKGLPEQTAAVSEETKGPRVGAPPQALEGFLRKTGLTADQLVERDGVLFAIVDKPGRATAEVLAAAIPAVIRAFPWPKSMRWGADSLSTESLRWVRPLQGIVALFGSEVVPCEIAGVASGAATVGHRFHHPGAITIGSADDYVEKLRACHVIVDGAERRNIIALGAKMAAQKAGLSLIEDEGLLYENAGLTEWPMPLLGRFDEAFLAVPPEVIQLTARVNQKYFVCRDSAGKLANAFVCVANIDAADGGEKIVAGNQKVLAARLSDARFFYETDLKVKLADQAVKLEKIVFHEKLGTVADKVERVAKLARWLVESGVVISPSPLVGEGRGPSRSDGKGEGDLDAASPTPPHPSAPSALPPSPTRGEGELATLAERAARLAKADLVTGMVGEFPELQGLMGGYYAAAQGQEPAVAAAIRDHYKPVGQGDDVPTDPVTVAVALADKLDTLARFFLVEEKPTGSRDPYALRRAALGVVSTVTQNSIRLPLRSAITEAVVSLLPSEEAATLAPLVRDFETIERMAGRGGLSDSGETNMVERWDENAAEITRKGRMAREKATADLLDFFADRLKVQQREAGVRHDLIDAVFALGGEDDLVRLLERVKALQAFVGTEDGANLLAGYKRAANILKKEGVATASAPAKAGAQGSEGQGNPGPLLSQGHEVAQHASGFAYDPEPAEAALAAALDAAEPKATAAIEAEDFEGAMAALAILRAPIDAFFDSVTVNDADPVKRAARLSLLARMRDAVHKVADFAKIEG
ncbi:glycine--tRNA ligase subunit beta [Sphingomonas pokkalii]|uniref:Glycine--tRNA ligase beta subunit n=1 Tax=Sphingomonas pokkalii TaxID=2175090 RepID=A0A2U0SDY6_9SPHN|nr:glycine--tRNA ligase subunit beta [Sphingomonas pokkalii]PVX29583.1 glycine--tRNA ligase subunit beta [Sphingomonas pokkalii]